MALFSVAVLGCGSRSQLEPAGQEPASDPAQLDAPSNEQTQGAELRPSTFTGSDPVRDPTPVDSQPDSASGVLEVGPEPTGTQVRCDPSPNGLTRVFNAVQQALEAEPPDTQAHVRYVVAPSLRTETCTLLAPQLKTLPPPMPVAPSDGQLEAWATTKMINSVSLADEIHPVVAVPNTPWLLRIDLRDYAWDQPFDFEGQQYPNVWEALVAHASQSLRLVGSQVEATLDRAQTRVPFLLAADLLATVADGELYYALLNAPPTIAELRERLGISSEETFDTPAWVRAGFSTNGPTSQVRGAARYVGPSAPADLVYWQTFDYEPNSSFPGPYRAPLGSEADWNSVLYSLPNGMWATYLADSQGGRVQEVPVSVDINSFAAPGTRTVSSGCLDCHRKGPEPLVDDIRPLAGREEGETLSDEELATLQTLYPDSRTTNTLVNSDSERMQKAVTDSGVPQAYSDSEPEPISGVLRRHRQESLSFDSEASELFVTREALEQLPQPLPTPLEDARQSRSVSRSQFNQWYREVLCLLQQGEPVQLEACL